MSNRSADRLLPCPACRKKIAASATACPKCGAMHAPGWQRMAQKILDETAAADRRRSRVVTYIIVGFATYALVHNYLEN